jgi:hypothetical protein
MIPRSYTILPKSFVGQTKNFVTHYGNQSFEAGIRPLGRESGVIDDQGVLSSFPSGFPKAGEGLLRGAL